MLKVCSLEEDIGGDTLQTNVGFGRWRFAFKEDVSAE